MRDLQMSLKRDTITLLLAAEQGSHHATRTLPEIRDETGTLPRRWSSRGPISSPWCCTSTPHELIVSKQTVCGGRRGQPLIEEIFSDYRPVDGVQVAYSAPFARGGQPMLERRVIRRQIIPADPPLFRRPAP